MASVQANGDTGLETKTKSASFVPSEDLTDVGRYAYSAVCAHALHQLFDREHDKQYVVAFVLDLNKHLLLNKQVQSAMLAIAHGSSGLESSEAFVLSLKNEEIILERGFDIIIHDLILLAIKNGGYDARTRVLIKYLCFVLHVSWEGAQAFEDAVMDRLNEEEHVQTEEEQNELKSKVKKEKLKRYALIGLATVGGGTLIGLTGGLAAPFLAAGAGAVIGGAGAAALGTTAGVAIIGSLFGVAGAGLTGYKMKKRVGGVEEFEFEPMTEGRQLHITLAVCGWLSEEMPDFRQPWRCLSHSKEQYVLRWESKYLKELGKAMNYLYRFAINAAAQEALKYTILSGILAAIAWPATLLTAASVIDNPWSVCTTRASAVGKQLAAVLLSRQQGKRPVTLIGFSLGARVIFYCLQEMAKSKHCEGIIEDVVLLGAPVTGNPQEWQQLSKVVAGRIVNGYCRADWLLKFVYRTASVQFSIAGLGPIKWHHRCMHNMDLSDVVSGHLDYLSKIKEILEVVGIPVKEVPHDTSVDSLKKWVQIQKSSSSSSSSPASSSSMPASSSIEKPCSDSVAMTIRDKDAGCTATAGQDVSDDGQSCNQSENQNNLDDGVLSESSHKFAVDEVSDFKEGIVSERNDTSTQQELPETNSSENTSKENRADEKCELPLTGKCEENISEKIVNSTEDSL